VSPAQFLDGINDGVVQARKQLGAIVRTLDSNPQCGAARVVLAGYSQGAMVMHRLVNSLDYNVVADRALIDRIGEVLLIADGDCIPFDTDLISGSAWDKREGR